MATFSQHHVDGLDLALTPIQAMLRLFPNSKEQEVRHVSSHTSSVLYVDIIEWERPQSQINSERKIGLSSFCKTDAYLYNP